METAAEEYAPYNPPIRLYFIDGAIWHKEHHNGLKEAAERALDYLNTKYPKEAEILHELKQAIELWNK